MFDRKFDLFLTSKTQKQNHFSNLINSICPSFTPFVITRARKEKKENNSKKWQNTECTYSLNTENMWKVGHIFKRDILW